MNETPNNAPPLEYATPIARRPSWVRTLLIAANLFLVILIVAPWLDVTGLLPGRNRHHHAPEQFCNMNLRQIGLAILMYANSDNDRFPPSLHEVLLTQEITSDVFVCPGSRDTPAAAPTTQQTAALLLTPNGHHCSYFYVGDGLTNATVKDDDVIAFELPANHGGIVNMLFGDMHVEMLFGSRSAGDAARIANLQADCAAGVRPIKLRQ